MLQKIQTVLGPIHPEASGTTLCHEHLSLEFEVAYCPNPDPKLAVLGQNQNALTSENLWWTNLHPYSNKNNLKLSEEKDAVIKEMHFFKENGGDTLVENTTYGIARQIEFLREIAKETGVNIVAGTGYYVDASRQDTVQMAVEQMADHMTKELTQGCDDTDIRCGVIGEIGCSYPLTKSEKNAVEAAGVVQSRLKCPVIIHPGRNPTSPQEILQIYQEAGGDKKKLIMSHLDRTLHSDEQILEFADQGCILEYDLFGMENSHYQLDTRCDMPSDAERIRRIKMLIDNGFGENITISHDIHTKHRLMKYGGHGYSHIIRNILPKMETRGISKKEAESLVISTPQRWLQWHCDAY